MSEGDATKRSVRVPPSHAGERLDRFLATALGDISRARVKRLITAGRVRVNAAGGAVASVGPALLVKADQMISLSIPAAAPAAPVAQAMALDVRFEDDHLIVVNKPAGLVVHPAPGNPDRTLVNALLAHCGPSLSGIGGIRRPGIVHRLDKDTSGLLVVAKTDAAHAGLAAQFAARTVARAYFAVIRGVPRSGTGEITGNIGRARANRKKMAVVTSGGREALTRYRVVARYAQVASLVECRLATGRTHQIRVHLAHIGHPVIGDPLYGRGIATRHLPAPVGAAIGALSGQALHARLLGFTHPLGGENLKFTSDPPHDMERLIGALARSVD